MKILNILFSIGRGIRFISIFYRIIGLIACVVFFNSNFRDLMFLSTSEKAHPMSIEELFELPKNERPRYVKLDNVTLLNSMYVATQNEDSGKILSALYPVYSLSEISKYDSLSIIDIEAHVLVKDNDFNEEKLQPIMTIEGLYDDSQFEEEKNILVKNGIKVSSAAIVVTVESPPSFNQSLLWTILTGLGGILLLFSIIAPSRKEVIAEGEENILAPDDTTK